MVAQSGGEVNRLLDRRLVERFPAIDAAQGDLPRGHQGPEQHGRRVRVGQRALGLHPALELSVQAVGGSTYTLTVVRKDFHCCGGYPRQFEKPARPHPIHAFFVLLHHLEAQADTRTFSGADEEAGP